MNGPVDHHGRILNCLLGTALGDSLGLPFEGLSPNRASKLFPGVLRHRLFFGRGMVSDDTEHAIITLIALRNSNDDLDKFEKELGRGLRGWFLALPPGVGLSTAKACIKLCIGIPPKKSGVYSAGNGPLMRAPVIGVWFADEPDKAIQFAQASARITHTHPLALQGAALVALAAASSARGNREIFHEGLPTLELDAIWGDVLQPPTPHPKGVGRFIVPAAKAVLSIWQQYSIDLDSAIEKAIRMGGDADTTAAVVGGIVGAHPEAVPNIEWLSGIRDWSGNAEHIQAVCAGKRGTLAYPAQLLRNGLLLGLALGHGLRRLFPPY